MDMCPCDAIEKQAMNKLVSKFKRLDGERLLYIIK